jgi:hypothetical protein
MSVVPATRVGSATRAAMARRRRFSRQDLTHDVIRHMLAL